MCVLYSFSAHQGLDHLKEFGLEIPSFWTLTWLKSNKKCTGFNADLTGSKVKSRAPQTLKEEARLLQQN